jgi:hypothetical protein
MPRKPNGDRAMTANERSSKRRERERERIARLETMRQAVLAARTLAEAKQAAGAGA